MGGNRVNLKNVPTGAWIFAAVAFVSALAALVVLSVTGSDSSEVRWLLLGLLNLGGIVTGVSSTVYSGAAAKNAQDAKEQTNGLLDAERKEIAAAAAREALAAYKREVGDGS